MSGFVYFVRCGAYVKIGHSSHPMARLRLIRFTARALIGRSAVKMIGAVRGSLELESDIHDRLGAHWADIKRPRNSSLSDCGGRMEWFRADTELLAWIDGLRSQFVPLDSMRRTYPRR